MGDPNFERDVGISACDVEDACSGVQLIHGLDRLPGTPQNTLHNVLYAAFCLPPTPGDRLRRNQSPSTFSFRDLLKALRRRVTSLVSIRCRCFTELRAIVRLARVLRERTWAVQPASVCRREQGTKNATR